MTFRPIGMFAVAFGLTLVGCDTSQAGSDTVSPGAEVQPELAHVTDIPALLASGEAACVERTIERVPASRSLVTRMLHTELADGSTLRLNLMRERDGAIVHVSLKRRWDTERVAEVTSSPEGAYTFAAQDGLERSLERRLEDERDVKRVSDVVAWLLDTSCTVVRRS